MYDVFDGFLARETWRSAHAYDEEAYFVALETMIDDQAFSPEAMGDYFHRKASVPRQPGQPRDTAIQHYVHAAWAVQSYLKAVSNL
jgi:hypothetical protein